MKIIHITASYKPAYIYGGPIQSVGKLCEALGGLAVRSEGLGVNEVQILTTTANGTNELDMAIDKPVLVEGVKVTYFKRWTKDHSHFSPGLLRSLRRKILRHFVKLSAGSAQHNKLNTTNQNLKGPPRLTDTPPEEGNIVHIHAWWNLVSVLSCLVAMWYKIPVVLSPRGMLTSYTFGNRNSFPKKIIHKLLGERLLKYCHIHATSEQEKRDILTIVQPKSIRVIANLVSLGSGVADSGYQIASGKYQESLIFNIIFLSRIEKKKGLELLFEALALVDIPWRLTIGGTGKEEYVQSLKDKAEKLKLSERITWLGQVSNADKFNLMAMHDLTVLTSYNENFANVVVESLSVGTPVLISKFVGLADYVSAKNLGWITGLGIEEIKTGIVSAQQDIEKRKKIRSTAPLQINADFNDDTLVKQYVELYKEILASPIAL
ncbi:glycosyltransferase [Pedobacter sp. ISL-68]|uniref:XrtY-associated glycosyltransferase XYAG1 n=1 Tax=unclassified Pedobacter TaxID=2628915 RepID=UPI001BEA43D2|nr:MULTISPECIES: glycosyltransferase [unclassified Pedobacter]MBT2562790.1 glycosyltransferase [Pedobacter sp. ISL-64]MBT2593303.1 glycosyltransferase [Pedobacter sp. ISL-68]